MSDASDSSANAPVRLVRLAAKSARAERRADGAILIHSTEQLQPYPESWNARLAHWARTTPDNVFLTGPNADRRQTITYAETLAAVQSIGEGLLGLGLSSERPLAILAENSIDCALVTLASLWIGVAASPISPAYALKATDFTKLASVIDALGPGAIYVADGVRYSAAVRATAPEASAIISGGAPVDERKTIALSRLKTTRAGAHVDAANAAVSGDTIGKIMFTSGSSGAPKPVIQPHRMLAVNRQQCAQAYAFLNDAPPVMVDWLPWHHTRVRLRNTLNVGGARSRERMRLWPK